MIGAFDLYHLPVNHPWWFAFLFLIASLLGAVIVAAVTQEIRRYIFVKPHQVWVSRRVLKTLRRQVLIESIGGQPFNLIRQVFLTASQTFTISFGVAFILLDVLNLTVHWFAARSLAAHPRLLPQSNDPYLQSSFSLVFESVGGVLQGQSLVLRLLVCLVVAVCSVAWSISSLMREVEPLK